MRSRAAGRRRTIGRALGTRYKTATEPDDNTLRSQALNNLHTPNATAGWKCRLCRRADLANTPCPPIPNHSGDCTCACDTG